jgi:hypothetical protein
MSLTKVTYSMVSNAPINLKDFGAVGDGVADDTAAVQAWLDADGSLKICPPGTYYIPSGVLTTKGDQKIVCAPDAEFLLKTGDTIVRAIQFQGSVSGTSHALASNGTKGDISITLTSGAGANYATGDWIILRSNKQFAPDRVATTYGTSFLIFSVVGDVITLNTALPYDYATANNAAITKVNPIQNVHWEGGKITGADSPSVDLNQTGMVFTYAKDCIVRSLSTQYITDNSLFFDTCMACTTHDQRGKDLRGGNGYGVFFFNACRDCYSYDGVFEQTEHAVSFSGSNGVSENCGALDFIVNNYFNTGSTRPPVDTHAGCGRVKLRGYVAGADGNAVNVESPYVDLDITVDYSGQEAVQLRNYSVEEAEFFVTAKVGKTVQDALHAFKPAGASVADIAYISADVVTDSATLANVRVTSAKKIDIVRSVANSCTSTVVVDNTGLTGTKVRIGYAQGNCSRTGILLTEVERTVIDTYDLVVAANFSGIQFAGTSKTAAIGTGFVNVTNNPAVNFPGSGSLTLNGMQIVAGQTSGTRNLIDVLGGDYHIISNVSLLEVTTGTINSVVKMDGDNSIITGIIGSLATNALDDNGSGNVNSAIIGTVV